jgi:hypothetical protein
LADFAQFLLTAKDMNNRRKLLSQSSLSFSVIKQFPTPFVKLKRLQAIEILELEQAFLQKKTLGKTHCIKSVYLHPKKR